MCNFYMNHIITDFQNYPDILILEGVIKDFWGFDAILFLDIEGVSKVSRPG